VKPRFKASSPGFGNRRKKLIMSHPVLMLELPEDIYERVRRAAKGMNQPVEKALVNIVRAATPSLEKVPAEYRAELEAMEDLDDEELRRTLERHQPPSKQRRLEQLLDKNQNGALTGREKQTLARLRSDGDRLMLQRSYAALLLKYRGNRLSSVDDFER
jgi:hypothetical protein